MAKGFFTQSADVLLSKDTSLDAVVSLLSEFEIVRRTDAAGEDSGATCGSSVSARGEWLCERGCAESEMAGSHG